MVCFQQVDGCCNSKFGLGSKITQFGVEDLVLGLEEWRNSHTQQQQPQGPKTHKKVNNQIDNQNQCSVPPKVPSLQALGLV